MQAVVAEIRVRDRGHIQPVFCVPVFGPPYGSVPRREPDERDGGQPRRTLLSPRRGGSRANLRGRLSGWHQGGRSRAGAGPSLVAVERPGLRDELHRLGRRVAAIARSRARSSCSTAISASTARMESPHGSLKSDDTSSGSRSRTGSPGRTCSRAAATTMSRIGTAIPITSCSWSFFVISRRLKSSWPTATRVSLTSMNRW